MYAHLPLLSLALASSLAAQVAVDRAIAAGIRDPVLNHIVDPAARQSQPITGLSAAAAQANSVAIDPVTGATYFGNLGSPVGEVRHVALAGNQVTQERVIATFGAGEQVHALDFDGGGNLFAVTGLDRTGVAIYRIERGTNRVVRWDTESYNGAFNAIAIDRERDRMWIGVWNAGTILEYDLAAGPARARSSRR